MKKFILILFLFVSCHGSDYKPYNHKKLEEGNIEPGMSYRIVEIEGHRYLMMWRGGISHLESCENPKCK